MKQLAILFLQPVVLAGKAVRVGFQGPLAVSGLDARRLQIFKKLLGDGQFRAEDDFAGLVYFVFSKNK